MFDRMQIYRKTFVVLLIWVLISSCNNREKDPKDIDPAISEGLYLGLKPPGDEPEAFAPGIVSTDHYEYSGTFTPDMKEFYFIRQGGKYEEATFIVLKRTEREWQEFVVSKRVGQPVISPDGNIMHLGNRFKKRTETGWSEVRSLEPPFEELRIMRLSAAANGTYYFDTYDENNPEFPIRYSRLIDGSYEEPRILPSAINTGSQLNHPFIAPDESYLIWDAKREGGYGDSDIYISFRQQDGSWGEAINMGDRINTGAWEASASVTPDGKYLFFSRNVGSENYENVDIFWVDARVIDNLRNKQ